MGIEQFSKIWPEWNVVEQIGSGSYGKVYKVERSEHGITDYAAVKVITIPKNETGSDKTAVLFDNYDSGESASHSYLESMVTDFVNEIKLMVSMKHTPYIVSVEDYKVIEKTEGIGWDIFIRMELLTSFVDYASSRNLTESDVIKLGQDLCSGLELCASKSIIHRDIKPENIFVTQQGSFKLGDFGIAKEKSSDAMSMTAIGTFKYIAPEVVKREKYGQTVDIYSLGIVLYRLLNNNRLPFLNPNGQINYQDDRLAVDKRINGEQMPPPVGASPEMADVILRACQYESAKRYQTATEFKNALEAVRTGTYIIPQKYNLDERVEVQQVSSFCSKCGEKRGGENNFCVSCGKSFGKKMIPLSPAQLIAIVAVFVAIIVSFFVFILPLLTDNNDPPHQSASEPTPIVKATPPPTINSEQLPEEIEETPSPIDDEIQHEDEDEYLNIPDEAFDEFEDMIFADFVIDFILPFSSTRLITNADLYDLDLWELRIARNEIFARHGRLFNDPVLVDWFMARDWYREISPKFTPAEFNALRPNPLSSIERANVDIIIARESILN